MKNILVVICVLFTSMLIAQHSTPSKLKTEKNIQNIGDVARIAMPAAAVLTTVIIGDKEGTWQFAKAFGVNLAVTFALKYAINKPRPKGATDGLAFPSGHTSVAFQSASFIQRRYGWKYGIPSYALAGLVAYSRIQGTYNRHDGWDILGGAIVGVGSTYLFTTPYQKEHFEFSFNTGDDNYLLGFKYKF